MLKLRDIRDVSKEDILGALGLESKATTGEWLIGSIGLFGLGIVVGAAAALAFAPKSGRELRQDLTQKVGSLRNGQKVSDAPTLEGV